MSEDKRFLENSKTVEEIAKLFGLELVGFNPSWEFRAPNYEDGSTIYVMNQAIGYLVPDDMMSKIALLLGLEWIFERDEKEILERVQHHKSGIEREKELVKVGELLNVEKGKYSDKYIKDTEDSIKRLYGVLETRKRLISCGKFH